MADVDNSLEQILAIRHGGSKEIINVDEETVKLVIIVLANDWYAFEGRHIKEILKDSEVFFLPGCPAVLEGVINVRGDIESVFNLRTILRYPTAPALESSRILLAQSAQLRSGIRVDRVEEVTDVVQSAICPPPHTIPDHLRPLVVGHLEWHGQVVNLLDLKRLFTDYLMGAG